LNITPEDDTRIFESLKEELALFASNFQFIPLSTIA
jgi:hypothetical protein